MKVVLAILFFLSICVGTNCKTAVDARISQRELAIYKILLGDKPKEMVVVTSDSYLDVFGIDRDAFKGILNGLRNDTFDNFVEVNTVLPKLDSDTQANFSYPLVSANDFNNDNLKHSRYYVFSRVGFSRNNKQAVVRFSHVCLPLCGRGAYYLLENKNGVWVITQESEYARS